MTEPTPPTDLDPDDWEAFSHDAHAALDLMIAHLRGVRARKVWQKAPPEIVARFDAGVPRLGRDLPSVVAEFDEAIKPYVTGNTHPLFMGWVHGAGTPVGMVAEMLAAGLNANCGGRDHIGLVVERQIARWAAELFGFPGTASGIFVTGTSQANFMGVLVARNTVLGSDSRRDGIIDLPSPLVAYTSAEAHGCIAQAMEMSGLGSQHLRRVPVDAEGAMRCTALERMIAADRAAGLTPFLLVGTAGTVNIGAVDDLSALADIAARERLWFHVDGAFGALLALSPSLRPLIRGIERADSVGFDFHKWAHVPYDAGFLIVRDGAAHRAAFANPAAYLQRCARGLAAGETWPCDLGPDLSRGFRALKTWFTFQVHGADRIGASIETTCRLARILKDRLAASELFEVAAPVRLNIVCFSLKGSADGEANRELVMDLHERGLAAPSLTVIAGRPVIRAAIVNHRTTDADIDAFVLALHSAALRRMSALARPNAPLLTSSGVGAAAKARSRA